MKLKPLDKIKKEEGFDTPSKKHLASKKVRAGRNKKSSADPYKSTGEGRK